VLNEFDRVHGTQLFDGLRAEDVDVHKNEIETLLDRRRVLAATRVEVLPGTAVVAGRQSRSSWRTAPTAACSRSSAGSRSSPDQRGA
jgi:hypothetical protein